jgi:hypothetical protein
MATPLSPLFQSIVDNDKALEETLDQKVVPMIPATELIQKKRRLVKWADTQFGHKEDLTT